MGIKYTIAEKPCESCPYRKATPSGVWAEEEYMKLAEYDGDMGAQLGRGASAVFMCHNSECSGASDASRICRGWTDCHGGHNLAAVRMGEVMDGSEFPPGVFQHSGCAVYGSGCEARDAGMRGIGDPSPAALSLIAHLLRKHPRLYAGEERGEGEGMGEVESGFD